MCGMGIGYMVRWLPIKNEVTVHVDLHKGPIRKMREEDIYIAKGINVNICHKWRNSLLNFFFKVSL
jgi:hypothetical protein